MKQGWIDSHCHVVIDDLYKDLPNIVQNMQEAKVVRALIITMNLEELERAKLIKKEYPFFDIAFGYDPQEVDTLTEADLAVLEEVIKNNDLVAIGEIGLDYYWVKDNKERQKYFFIKQLELASKYNLPVIIHSREAAEDTYNLLKEANLKRKGVMHCYSGSQEMALRFVELGYYISIAGVVTFKNAKEIKKVATSLPLEYLLIETDSPFLTPEPYRGQRNEPAYVSYVGQMLAWLKEVEPETVQQKISENYYRLFIPDYKK